MIRENATPKESGTSCLFIAIQSVLYESAKKLWYELERDKFSDAESLEALQHIGSLAFSIAKKLTADAHMDIKNHAEQIMERNEI